MPRTGRPVMIPDAHRVTLNLTAPMVARLDERVNEAARAGRYLSRAQVVRDLLATALNPTVRERTRPITSQGAA